MLLDAGPPNNRSEQRDENLDVVRTSRDQENLQAKGSAGESTPDPHLSVVCPFPAQPPRQQKHRGRYRTRGSKYISVHQATNIIEAVKFAKSIGVPLAAHATIHWSGTIAFDDHNGLRFAKVREGLNKVLFRRGIPTAWVWCRECKAHTDIVHSHVLFHLPVEYRSGAKLAEIEARIERLVDRHGEGILGEFAMKLEVWPDPDGLYLMKGGGPKGVEALSTHSESMAHRSGCHLRQTVWHLREPRSGSTEAIVYRPTIIKLYFEIWPANVLSKQLRRSQ